MSAGIQAKGIARAIAGGNAKIREQNADNRRGAFLRALDESKHDVSQFEGEFLHSFMSFTRGKDASLDFQWFTPKRRAATDLMIQKSDVGSLQLRMSEPAPARAILRAESGQCQYLVREDGVQRECGLPGEYKGRTRPFLVYCKTHGEYVARSFEVVALDGSGRSLKPWHLQNRRSGDSL